MLRTRLTERLKISYPIIQAGMAGGVTTPQLVAAVSNAGGLGTLGAGYMSKEQIRSAVETIRRLTNRPFAVNLFIPESYQENVEDIQAMNRTLDTFRDELGIPNSPDITKAAEPFLEQLDVVIDLKVPVFSFTFGIPDSTVIQRLKQADIYTIGTATTVKEALALQESGIDAIVAQGSEAGGHRGTFADKAETALIGTMALVPQVADAVSVPVIAAGGIMDGRGLAACLMLGADCVQMGTAFIACPESGAHPVYKNALEVASEENTAITKMYSGKAARGLMTTFMHRMSSYQGNVPPYPIQNALTSDIRRAAAKANNPEYMSLWAGQGLRLVKPSPAAVVVEETARKAADVIRNFFSNGDLSLI
jgi:nitronate monooxygenase